ncbi:hypothetical protein OEZ85_004117 [Tetradesmus obliquus]|uniref:Ammonium transporter AmtB-like domain-containing protein n=1 Tax=Tetradesmus obliquus TaxID=3088 RepID=A0ABY8UGF6_TETOB|nr:hypothetical protein OEZ85_004117 [Tetradesmus obliquus]
MAPVDDATSSITSSLTILNGFLVFFMQVGFIALETGSGRAKNVRNILLKNLLDAMLTAICWWAVGYAFAYGQTANGIIGYSGFFYEGDLAMGHQRPWFLSFTFAVACCVIVSGCLAERTRLVVYPLYTVLITALVHPLLVHWIWVDYSWLNSLGPCRVLDFAGGLAVHALGGLFGLIGAIAVGPRLGRFDDGAVKDLPGHDMAFVTLGTFMLWFGWFGFNSGSVYVYQPTAPSSAVQLVAMNTTLSASSAGLASLAVACWWSGTYDLRVCCNGVLSGLVIVTGICGFVDPWAAAVCGLIAGVVYPLSSHALLRLGIDDPLDSSAVHLVNGVAGLLLLSFMAKPHHVALLTGGSCGGLFYSTAGWAQLGIQVLAITLTLAVGGVAAAALFFVLRRLNLLRVDQLTELAGIDNIDHGGPAYPEFNMQTLHGMGSHNGVVR